MDFSSTAQCAGSLAVVCVFVAASGFVLHVGFNSHSGRKTVKLDARDEDRSGEIKLHVRALLCSR